MGADPNPALFSVFHLFSLLFSLYNLTSALTLPWFSSLLKPSFVLPCNNIRRVEPFIHSLPVTVYQPLRIPSFYSNT